MGRIAVEITSVTGQTYRAFETGTEKWCKVHIPPKGKGDISEEGQDLLEDIDRWWDKTSLLKEYYESRKGERIHEDGSFMTHQKGPITSTYTTDWFLREGELRKGDTRRMDEDDLGQVSGPKKNAASNVT